MFSKCGDEMERLQKVIANAGYCSRRKAEEEIKKGHVTVNGKIVVELGTKVDSTDVVEINGTVIRKEEKKEYILFYKPREVITTVHDDKGRTTVLDYIDTTARIYPVGRLDYDTTGLLLLTNDGELANLLMHPKTEIEKVYVAKVKGILSAPEINKLKNGVVIDGRKTSRAKVKVRKIDKKAGTSIVEITIHEGRNHQVKKMFEHVGHEVLKLKRERFAFLDLKGLHSGEYRYLSIKEVKKLYALVNHK